MTSRFAQALPPVFDPAYYRTHNAELGLGDDEAAAAHYARQGRAEGRVASPFARREELVAAMDGAGPVLEIGPFCAPLLKGPGVEYLDRLDAAALRDRAQAIGLDASDCPERIHHVGGLDRVGADSFDAVLASHSIEHQPDLVRHLEEVARVLRAGGRYVLIVPDKRFCFDHFLPETTIADVLDAFEEERTIHRLGSVVEHVALVTHNDPVRHWRGDHGGVDLEERQRRTAEALAAYRSSDGTYLDVHAWQFTPESFVALFATLARLGLSAFEVEAVYDTPRDRAEFCAVLRLARPARRAARRRHGMDVTVLQTADPFRYARMLAVTAPNVTEYCRRHGLTYQSFVGLKRGAWSWHAIFNRIVLLQELLDAGFTGWALYLDADAYVRDLDFDLPAYLARNANWAAVLATSGMSDARWDVNSGVALINLGHPLGRRLVQAWSARFAALSDERLAQLREGGEDNDQDYLHAVLRDDPEIVEAVLVESLDLLNSAHARFVRQRLRAQFDTFEERLSTIRDEVAAVGSAWGLGGGAMSVDPGGRAAARLLHAVGSDPWLAEAPPGDADDGAIERALTTWRTAAHTPVAPQQQAFAAALAREDVATLAETLRGLGRSPLARGLLGGDRQHRRCADDPAFARERALRTHDALLSLAELTGAVSVESPDLGPWGVTRRISAPALFAGIERVLARDLRPPATIGAYLGVEVGRGLVLHLRMAEAIHTAWRIGQLAAMLNLTRVVELGGGIGLGAWYARRLGIAEYRLVAPAVSGALQAAVLGASAHPVDFSQRIQAPLDLLVVEDLATWPEEDALEHLRDAAGHGVRVILSFGQDAAADPARPQGGVADRLASLGGWQRIGRARHGLKPGYVEEIFLCAG